MLKSIVSPRSATEHIEAVQAERDFFREKYAAQMSEMEALRLQLKESQRVIDRLRRQVLDLEKNSCGSETAAMAAEDGVADEIRKELSTEQEEEIKSSFVADSLAIDTEDEPEQTTDDTEEEVNEKDEAHQIRANAERLLQWSDYQSRRSTTSPINSPTGDEKAFKFDDDSASTKTDDSENTNPSEREESFSSPLRMECSLIDSTRKNKVKMSNILNGIRYIIDPPFDDGIISDDERDESSDEEISIDHRSFDG